MGQDTTTPNIMETNNIPRITVHLGLRETITSLAALPLANFDQVTYDLITHTEEFLHRQPKAELPFFEVPAPGYIPSTPEEFKAHHYEIRNWLVKTYPEFLHDCEEPMLMLLAVWVAFVQFPVVAIKCYSAPEVLSQATEHQVIETFNKPTEQIQVWERVYAATQVSRHYLLHALINGEGRVRTVELKFINDMHPRPVIELCWKDLGRNIAGLHWSIPATLPQPDLPNPISVTLHPQTQAREEIERNTKVVLQSLYGEVKFVKVKDKRY